MKYTKLAAFALEKPMSARANTQPKFAKIKSIIKDRVMGGEFETGEALPTYDELACQYSVSNITIRRAVRELVSEGILVSQRGKRAFVADAKGIGNETQAIGLLTMKPYDVFLRVPFYVDVLNGLRTTLTKASKSLSIWQLDHEEEFGRIEENLRASSGCFAILGHFPRHLLQLIASKGAVVTCIDNMAEGIEFDGIGVDNVLGMYKATSLLISKGHRRIGFINDKLDSDVSKARLEGYRRALSDSNIEAKADLIADCYVSVSEGADATKKLCQTKGISALLAFDDTLAEGAMSFASEAGLDVPSDLAVMGFGNYGYISPAGQSLSSVAVDAKSIGEIAADRMIRRMRGDNMSIMKILVEAQLVSGDTT